MYLNHLALLSEDLSLKAKDRQKMNSYLLQWCNGKLLLGCALFLDILKPATVLCKVLQDDELCGVAAIESIWKTQQHTLINLNKQVLLTFHRSSTFCLQCTILLENQLTRALT